MLQNTQRALDFLDEVQRQTQKALKLVKRHERRPSAKPYDHLEKRLDIISEIRRALLFWGIGAETFERLVSEFEAMAARITGEILAGEFQRAERLAHDTPPRWIRDHAEFARVAADIRTACKAGRLGMFVKNPHAAVIANIAHHLGVDPRGDSEKVFSNCLDTATEAES